MKASTLLTFLLGLKEEGVDLSKVQVNYRKDYDSDVQPTEDVHGDLYDENTDSILQSIVLVGDTSDEDSLFESIQAEIYKFESDGEVCIDFEEISDDIEIKLNQVLQKYDTSCSVTITED